MLHWPPFNELFWGAHSKTSISFRILALLGFSTSPWVWESVSTQFQMGWFNHHLANSYSLSLKLINRKKLLKLSLIWISSTNPSMKKYLGGGNSNIFWIFTPENWGRWTHFIFFRWDGGSTTNQNMVHDFQSLALDKILPTQKVMADYKHQLRTIDSAVAEAGSFFFQPMRWTWETSFPEFKRWVCDSFFFVSPLGSIMVPFKDSGFTVFWWFF